MGTSPPDAARSNTWRLMRGGRVCFNRGAGFALPVSATFIVTVALLGLAREKARFPVLLLDRFFPGWGWLEILLLGFYAAWVGQKMMDPERVPAVRRRIWGLFSMVFFLQLLGGLAGAEVLLMTGDLHLPVPAVILAGPIYRGGGFFMLILFALTLVLVGPAWCSHLCYIGSWDDITSRLKERKPAELPGWVRNGRWIILGLVAATALLLRLFGVPGGIAAALGGAFGIFGVGIMVLVSRTFGVMVHCIAYCPLGLVSNLLGKISPWRIRIRRDCTRCGACMRTCRYGALQAADFERGQPGLTCTLCGDCLKSCRQESISYHFPGVGAEAARRAFQVLVVSLHAVYMGIARM